VCRLGAAGGRGADVRVHVDVVGGPGAEGVERHGGQLLGRGGGEDVGRPPAGGPVAQHLGGAEGVVLVAAGVVGHGVDAGVHAETGADVGVVVGNVKVTVVAERRAPAVADDEGAVPRRHGGEVVAAVAVVPAHDGHRVVGYRLVRSVIGVSGGIEGGVAPVHGGVHAPDVHDRLLDVGVVQRAAPVGHQDGVLDVLAREQAGRRIRRERVVRVVGFGDGSAPADEVGQRHEMVAPAGAAVGIEAGGVLDVVFGKIPGLARQQRGLEAGQGGERPASAARGLVPDGGEPALGPQVVTGRRCHLGTVLEDLLPRQVRQVDGQGDQPQGPAVPADRLRRVGLLEGDEIGRQRRELVSGGRLEVAGRDHAGQKRRDERDSPQDANSMYGHGTPPVVESLADYNRIVPKKAVAGQSA